MPTTTLPSKFLNWLLCSMEACIADKHLEGTWSNLINSIDEDDSYIEIELDSSPTCYNSDDDEDGGESKGYQLRISISSTISMSLEDDRKESLRNNSSVTNMAAIEAPCMSSSLVSISADDATAESFTESQEIIEMPLNKYSSITKKIDEKGVEVEFSVQNGLCNTVPSNRRVGLESAQPAVGQTTTQRTTRVIPRDKVVVLPTSATKQPNLMTTTTTTKKDGSMMKLLIKFRGIKFGALLASLMKPKQSFHANNNGHNNKSSKKSQSKTLFHCYQKKMVNPRNGRSCNYNNINRDQGIRRSYKNWDLEDDNSSLCGSFRSSRVMEMDLGALRGIIFNTMGMSISQKGNGSKRSSSRSTSCDTTPIHEGFSLYSGENSNNIQAAVAYCKSSLGQTSDFS